MLTKEQYQRKSETSLEEDVLRIAELLHQQMKWDKLSVEVKSSAYRNWDILIPALEKYFNAHGWRMAVNTTVKREGPQWDQYNEPYKLISVY